MVAGQHRSRRISASRRKHSSFDTVPVFAAAATPSGPVAESAYRRSGSTGCSRISRPADPTTASISHCTEQWLPNISRTPTMRSSARERADRAEIPLVGVSTTSTQTSRPRRSQTAPRCSPISRTHISTRNSEVNAPLRSCANDSQRDSARAGNRQTADDLEHRLPEHLCASRSADHAGHDPTRTAGTKSWPRA